jgi:hypothetical protein
LEPEESIPETCNQNDKKSLEPLSKKNPSNEEENSQLCSTIKLSGYFSP